MIFSATINPNSANHENWYLDSGATNHFAVNQTSFTTYKTLEKPTQVKVANKDFTPAIGIGTIELQAKIGQQSRRLTIMNVLHRPKIDTNLLSTTVIMDKGFDISMKDGQVKIFKDDNLILTTIWDGNMFRLNLDTKLTNSVNKSSNDDNNLQLWHHWLRHLGINNIQLLSDGMALGILIKKDSNIGICQHCLHGGQHWTPSNHQASKTPKVLELIHTNICGPMNTTSVGNAKYFLLFIDDYSRITSVYFLKHRSKAFDKFREYKAYVENFHNLKIKQLQSDNGKEYTSYQFNNYLKNSGIQHEQTVPYTPQQNGVSERSNRTIMEKARSLLHESELGYEFWAEAVATTIYLKNRSPTIVIKGKTPYEIWFGKKPSLHNLQIFGCLDICIHSKRETNQVRLEIQEMHISQLFRIPPISSWGSRTEGIIYC